jgi:hypothetical protein
MTLNLLGLIGIGTALILWRRLRQLRRKQADIRPAQPTATGADFSDQLHSAALEQRLRESGHRFETPERYRFAAALASQGMDPERIGETLNLAAGEVRQVIALAQAGAPREAKTA